MYAHQKHEDRGLCIAEKTIKKLYTFPTFVVGSSPITNIVMFYIHIVQEEPSMKIILHIDTIRRQVWRNVHILLLPHRHSLGVFGGSLILETARFEVGTKLDVCSPITPFFIVIGG